MTDSDSTPGRRQRMRIVAVALAVLFCAPLQSFAQLRNDFGHYLDRSFGANPDTILELVDAADDAPGLSGVVWRMKWASIEGEPGVYDWTLIDTLKQRIANSGQPDMKIFLMIMWKSFGDLPNNPCPEHLRYLSAPNAAGGETCFMWESTVYQAFNSMLQAFGARYNSDPAIEGIVLQETSLGFNGSFCQDSIAQGCANDGTYVPGTYFAALRSMIRSCSFGMPNLWCVQYGNYIHGDQELLGTRTDCALVSHGCNVADVIDKLPNACLSGPDALPSDSGLYLNDDRIYEVLRRQDGPGDCRSISIQRDSYEVPEQSPPDNGSNTICNDDYCQMWEIFGWSVRNGNGAFEDGFDGTDPYDSGLCVNSFLFWAHRRSASPNSGLSWQNAIPVINNNPYGTDWTERCPGGGGPLN